MNKILLYSRNLIIAILSLSIFFAGCKKSNDANNGNNGNAGDYYLKFKADGDQKEFKSEPLIQLLPLKDGLYSAVLQGYADFVGQGTKDELGMIVLSNDPIVQGSSFQDPQKCVNKDGDTLTKLITNFNDINNKGYLSMGTLVDKNGVNTLFPSVIADAKLNISELNSDFAKGTFSATVYLSTDATLTQKVKITDGEFYLKRVQ